MISYGKSGTEKLITESAECRDIVKEILDFGVNQHQLLKIIYLLSLELENGEIMSDISTCTKRYVENLSTDNDNISGIIT